MRLLSVHTALSRSLRKTHVESVALKGPSSTHRSSSSVSTDRGTKATPYLSEPKTQLLDTVDTFIFDCDGVIWKGDSLLPGIPETLERLEQEGKKSYFITNNATKSRKGYKAKFDQLGLDFVPYDSILSSSFAAAAYLEQIQFLETGKKVYVVGEAGICEELEILGVPYLGGPADKDKVPFMGDGGKVEIDQDIGAVVAGIDRNINYYKLQYAQLCINQLNARFIATNLDAVGHFTNAQAWAGAGTIVGAIKGCTGKEPYVVGKPNALLIEYLEWKYDLDRQRICMVGDRLDTDILFGTQNNLKSLMVLSGVTSEAKLMDPENDIRPDYYAEDINALFS
eukprot:Nitzschia sp. Nitz4//scaffold55_size114948//444//1522//NITZ4_003876-RA/size114948-snap-gene-0.165-mRNA-1//1//CDS//3329554455//6632//frame0